MQATPTCRSSAHREPACLSGCNVDTVSQRGDDQPCTITKVFVSACRHDNVDRGMHNRALNMCNTGYCMCLRLMLRRMCNGISSLTAEYQLRMLHAYRNTVAAALNEHNCF